MPIINTFAPWSSNPNCFIVRNVADSKKTIKIFNYPILWANNRDLMKIPGVAEGDIRASLLKGELNHKIKAQEIIILCSDIDLLQFNDAQKMFLQSAGVVDGLEVAGGGSTSYLLKQKQPLMGQVDGTNRTFTLPNNDKFIEGSYLGNEFHIQINHNGRELELGVDFMILESGGINTGYDTIYFKSFAPSPTRSHLLYANYMVSYQ